MKYEAVIGLEVHAEVLTNTKAFCSCTTEFGGRPNTHVCPVCLGLPGALPKINKEVIEKTIKAGLALNCKINKHNRFDRKNYFYPDTSKNYQITQDEFPICTDGYIEIETKDGVKKKIGIERIHMEEDAGKQLHTRTGTLVDFNRCGAPLMEIVTKPDIKTPEEATLYLTKLRSILFSLGVSDVKMEEGSLRCDGNISIREKGEKGLGVKSEIKNMNSFKALEKALSYEYDRQVNALEKDEALRVETRRWDEETQSTKLMRTKEELSDYRFFPEGDLPPLYISDEWINSIRKTIKELPYEKEERFIKDYDLPKYDAMVLTQNDAMAVFFEETAKENKDYKSISNWLMGDISRLLNESNKKVEDLKFKAKDLSELIDLINSSKISSAAGKKVLEEMFSLGKQPMDIVKEKGLIQDSDEDSILLEVLKVLDENPNIEEEYSGGRVNIVGFAVGQIMKATRGKANPKIVNKLVRQELEKRK
ncbi:MAG: Asp-tRNA(Asn)/Glu-tRNA(Gln) amidotransferase subunit GatB [Clostridium sp.]|nr:Asp-tRNA(Asn)/Glu-tRNA(Gln) amidotransferase subunit GatB [Clostridium sp.]